jgi:hypothetical protein
MYFAILFSGSEKGDFAACRASECQIRRLDEIKEVFVQTPIPTIRQRPAKALAKAGSFAVNPFACYVSKSGGARQRYDVGSGSTAPNNRANVSPPGIKRRAFLSSPIVPLIHSSNSTAAAADVV